MKKYKFDYLNEMNIIQYWFGFKLIRFLAWIFKLNIRIGIYSYEYGKMPKTFKGTIS